MDVVEKFGKALADRRAEHLEMYAAAYLKVSTLPADQVSLIEEHLGAGRNGFRWTFEPKDSVTIDRDSLRQVWELLATINAYKNPHGVKVIVESIRRLLPDFDQ